MERLRAQLASWWIFSQTKKTEDDLTPRQTNLCFLTFPGKKAIVLNLQSEGRLLRFDISREQLGRLVADGIQKVIG